MSSRHVVVFADAEVENRGVGDGAAIHGPLCPLDLLELVNLSDLAVFAPRCVRRTAFETKDASPSFQCPSFVGRGMIRCPRANVE